MRLAQKVILPAALTLLLLRAGAGTALAQSAPGDLATQDKGSTAYFSDNYAFQSNSQWNDPGGWQGATKVKSFSPWRWGSGPNSLRYAAPPPSIADDVQAVVAAYNTAFPSLQMVETLPADLTFDADISGNCPGFLGCYAASGFVLAGDAWWPTLGAIHVDASQTQAVRRNVIAHEIGHLYGMDEGYLKDSGIVYCNHADPASAMDAIGCDGDLAAPTPYDRQRITAYWTAQAPTVMAAQPSGSTTMVHLWKSNGYTETSGEYKAENWDGTRFVVYAQAPFGLSQLTFKWQDWRTSFGSIDISPLPATRHRMCIRTHSYGLDYGVDGWGPWGCREYPSTRLVGFWQFEEGTGNAANDSSGYGNHGTLYNSPVWVTPGKVGSYALSFNGSNQYVGIPDSTTLPFLTTSPWTISMWVNYQGNNSYYPQFSKGGTTYGFTIHGSDGRIQGGNGSVLDPHTFDQYNMFGGLVGQGWKHTAITYDGLTFKAYVDGSLKSTLAWTWGIGSSGDGILLGAFWGPYYYGLLDEVRIYGRALADWEVRDLCNCP